MAVLALLIAAAVSYGCFLIWTNTEDKREARHAIGRVLLLLVAVVAFAVVVGLIDGAYHGR